MFKSLFAKYISIFIVIVFIGFLVLTFVMTYFIATFSTNVKYDTLSHIANSVSYFSTSDSGTQYKGGEPTLEERFEFNRIVNILSNDMDELSVFITDKDGKIMLYKSSGDIKISDFFSDGKNAAVAPDYIEILESGHTVKITGTMEGFLGEHRASVGIPVFVYGNFSGSVFATTADTQPGGFIETMSMTLIMASLCIMLACMIAVYVITVRFTKPLREMSLAAKEYAKGNFDVTIPVSGDDEIAELATAFNEMAGSLANLESMRSSFISSVSHELRTPMTTIGGFVDSILDGVIPPEEQKHYLEIISSEVKRLSRLVTSLLEISRMETGQITLNPTVFDVCEMTKIILLSNEKRIEEKNLDVSYVCDEEHINVKADKDSIHRVILNLMDNAIKFSREGGKYEISLAKKGEKAEICVFDEGIGIKEKDLPFVFDRFYKTDKSRGLDRTGVGLGLFLVKSIINLHGENIKVESESGEWCKFTFTLPLAEESRKTDE